MNKLKHHFTDPWKLFTAVALALLFLLVIVSQAWILKSSLQREGGSFTIRTSASCAELNVEAETVKGFDVQSGGDRLVILKGDKPVFWLKCLAPGEILLETADGYPAEISAEDDRLRIVSGKTGFSMYQRVFSGLFENNSSRALSFEKTEDGFFRLFHAPGAYLGFEDRSKSFTLTNYAEFFGRSRYLSAIVNSIIIMLASTAIASVLGVSLAYLYARYKVPGTSLVLTIVTMASISPPFLGAYAWRMLLGSSGIITRALGLDWSIVGMHGVIWVISWLVFPVIFLLTYDSFTSIDHSLRECSMSLGGDRRKTFFRIELPLAMPGIINGLYMAMMTAFTDFGTPYVISLDLDVLPVLIYKEYMNEVGGNLSIAGTGSMIMILFSSLILTAQRIYLAGRSYASVKLRQPSAMYASAGVRTRIYIFTGLVLLFAFIPHITVALSSFFEWKVGILTSKFTLGNFVRLFSTDLGSIGVTLFTGITATVLDIVFGLGIAYVIVKKRYPVAASALNILVMVPYLIPGTVLGLGFILIFNQLPLLLTGTWVILVLAYFVRKLPYSVKSAESSLYQVHPALEEAARSLGAKPMRSFFQVTLPLIVGGVISGATLSFLQIMTEISATIILYRPPWKPMTAVIFENTIDAGADFGIASAMTLLLMLMLYVPLYFVTTRTRKPKEARIEGI